MADLIGAVAVTAGAACGTELSSLFDHAGYFSSGSMLTTSPGAVTAPYLPSSQSVRGSALPHVVLTDCSRREVNVQRKGSGGGYGAALLVVLREIW